MKHIIRDINESDTEYLLKAVECINENLGDMEYELNKTKNMFESLETFTKNCINILSEGQSAHKKDLLNLLDILKS